MTDVMVQLRIDYLVASTTDILPTDNSIDATVLLGDGYLQSRGWAYDFNLAPNIEKRLNGLMPEKDRYLPAVNSTYMTKSNAKLKYKNVVEDYKKIAVATPGDRVFENVVSAWEKKHSFQLTQRINFIRYFQPPSQFCLSDCTSTFCCTSDVINYGSQDVTLKSIFESFQKGTGGEYDSLFEWSRNAAVTKK
jgi:hypothetical protein